MDVAGAALRPFLWLAVIAFLVGFVSYLALGRPEAVVSQEEEAWPAAVAAPVSAEWNVPKRI